MQRKINVIFRIYRIFVKIYVDNIIVFNQTLKKYLTYLYSVFQLLKFYEISFSSKKFFFSYFTVILLRQKINVFGFIIVRKVIVNNE